MKIDNFAPQRHHGRALSTNGYLLMLSINKKKHIQHLAAKKQRDAQGLFVAEGAKLVSDLIRGGLQPTLIVGLADTLARDPFTHAECDTICCTEQEIKSVSNLATPPAALAVFRKPDAATLCKPTDLTLVLDEVQDPGNLGTIIRVADWFGIRSLVCSRTCADAFGPKTVQATMGAIARVRVTETDLDQFLLRNEREWQLPVYGTFLDGEVIYQSALPRTALVIMGNEGRGISPALAKHVSHKLFIPPYPATGPTSESLNVATATAIVCSEFRRRLF